MRDFTTRELILLAVIMLLALCWWGDHRYMAREVQDQKTSWRS